MNCRFCDNHLSHVFIDLGNSPPSNSFVTREYLDSGEVFYPLKVYVCDKCFLVQINEYKKSEDIFNNFYPYFSSYSSTWLDHSKRYAEHMIERFKYDDQSLIIEIASNDGYLLQYFKEKNIPVLGIEPTGNTAQVAIEKGIDTRIEFFNEDLAQKLAAEGKKADLLLGNNVLAHVPDINNFVEAFKMLIKDDGIITMEFPHLMQLVEQNQFDTIYHEHYSYISFIAVKAIFEKHGLELFDVQELPTHGGSLRIFAKHAEDKTKEISENVALLLKKELDLGMDQVDYYKGFEKKVLSVKYDLISFLIDKKLDNKKVIAYGAAAKGNTLLNFCGIKEDLIQFAVDASPFKQGKYMPGSHIPIVSESEIKKYQPDYVIILPWNIQEEIIAQLSYIKDWGGKFMVPIPKLKEV